MAGHASGTSGRGNSRLGGPPRGANHRNGTEQGHMFHTSRWDYAYTGGSSAGGLTKLADKRVGIIGTGPTAIQA